MMMASEAETCCEIEQKKEHRNPADFDLVAQDG
jgi:hypothetical protein